MPDEITALDDGLGLTLVASEAGEARLRLDPSPLALVAEGGPVFVHGGALATCVDTASWYAAESASPGGWVVSSLSLDCMRLARAEPHDVHARCLRAGRTLAVVDVEISAAGDQTRVVAVGRVTLARAPSATG